MTPYELLLLPENLYYAWNKAKNLYRMSDGYVNQAELAEFELDLEERLKHIHEQFESGNYRLQKIRPLPRPKKIDDDDKYINRQYYHIAVDDQVAWIAIVNALGPGLDKEMPAWSYGNRLYRPAWYEDDDDKKSKLNIGPYRHSSGHLYKHFKHSWPLFRRHVYITARRMVNSFNKEEETEQDIKAFDAGIEDKLQYFKQDWWPTDNKNATLYYASIDLKQFFPSINTNQVINNLLSGCENEDSKRKLESILKSMFNFRLDKSGIGKSQILENVEPKFFMKPKGLPTGLFVSGFLSNVAMLEIDKDINNKIATNRKVAHFRFVDDHTIISYDFDELCRWIEKYKTIIETEINVKINEKKYDPESLSLYLRARKNNLTKKTQEKYKKQAEKDTEIDGKKPTKLQTKTLEQVSEIAVTDENVLSDKDLDERLTQLEWLLLADIPDREMRADTRAAFAAGKITRIASIKNSSDTDIVDIFRILIPIINIFNEKDETLSDRDKEKLAENIGKLDSLISEFLEKNKNNPDILEEYVLFNTKKQLDYFVTLSEKLEKYHELNRSKHVKRYFNLLLDAMKDHQSKPRLFFRLHQYCLSTGCHGLKDIAEWIKELRKKDNEKGKVWGDYYANLTLQLLAKNIILAVRRLKSSNSLRSEQNAAKSYIEDIARINTEIFTIKNEAWFHAMTRQNFAISVMVAAEFIENKLNLPELVKNLKTIHQHYKSPTFEDESSVWVKRSGYSAGVWAQLIEPKLSINDIPSCLWSKFESCFNYKEILDLRAVRRYPEAISDRAWKYFIEADYNDYKMKKSDSGWLSDILIKDSKKIDDAKESYKPTFKLAAKAIEDSSNENYISLTEWVKHARTIKNPFDPRISEWTALEIIRQLIEPEIKMLKYRVNPDSIHPHNIQIPLKWQKEENLTWESWRIFVREHKYKVTTNPDNLINDYRYSYNQFDTQGNTPQQRFEQKLRAVGMVLLGLLKLDHNLPNNWNIRGNERLNNLPRSQTYQSLAISSKTMLLIEACLEPKSAESRLITLHPDLFGWSGEKPNDTKHNLIQINTVNDLIDEIKKSQDNLEKNQLSVSNHQPRQLIPFDLEAIASSQNDEEENNDA